jgi:hypothetical protein
MKIRVPRYYKKINKVGYLVELIDESFNLWEFYWVVGSCENQPRSVLEQAEKALYRWIKSVALAEVISDAKLNHLVYDLAGDEWVLVDFLDQNRARDLSVTKNHDLTLIGYFDPSKALSGIDFSRHSRLRRISENIQHTFTNEVHRLTKNYTSNRCAARGIRLIKRI